MSAPTIAKATRVDRAVERLDAAVLRLESAMANGTPMATDGNAGEALLALQSENDALRALNRDAVARVDTVINRLENMLPDAKAT